LQTMTDHKSHLEWKCRDEEVPFK